MTTTRRTALAMLGLGTAAAVESETFTSKPARAGDLQSVAGGYDKERYAQAFENLARELRRDAVSVDRITLSATLEMDNIGDQHELTVRFVYMPEV
jgi:hypothetical protein